MVHIHVCTTTELRTQNSEYYIYIFFDDFIRKLAKLLHTHPHTQKRRNN